MPQLARDRQPRTFARAWLDDDSVYLTWPDVDVPASIEAALAALCSKVTRIGHSSSLVQMWLAAPEEVGEPTSISDDEGAAGRVRFVKVASATLLDAVFPQLGKTAANGGDTNEETNRCR